MSDTTRAFLEQESTDAVVITCISFRFRPQTEAALQKAFNISNYDLISIAGGAKNIASPLIKSRRRAVLADVAMVIDKHKVRKIILLNHQSCSKYAAEGHTFKPSESHVEKKFHQDELHQAGQYMKKRFPGIEVLLGYMSATEDGVIIEPVNV